jgi:hypothetical protein
MPALIMILLFLVAFIGILVFSFYYEKKRSEQLKEFAGSHGFIFYPEGNQEMINSLQDFELFKRGRSKKIKNLMFKQPTDAIKQFLFDYKFTTGSGRNSSTHKYTILVYQSDLLELPAFYMRPENLFDKIGSKFGFEDIDFPAYEGFSENYMLKGKNETAIRQFFGERIFRYFESEKKVTVEGNLNTLVIYSSDRRKKPDDLHAFIIKGNQIFDLFK